MVVGGRCFLARVGGPVVAGEDKVGHPVLDKVMGLPTLLHLSYLGKLAPWRSFSHASSLKRVGYLKTS
ncbi:hypothetical protein KY284_000928 [Solanum tuberosum]|nr:hypothetical protein KY284_000928 [Solanum tuberosum]